MIALCDKLINNALDLKLDYRMSTEKAIHANSDEIIEKITENSKCKVLE